MARSSAPPPPVPARAKKELGFGTLAGLMCAEAMSSVRLYGLGGRVGFAWYLAWLLPAALDIYAITMVRFFSLLPGEHPLRRKAAHEAIIALVITVGCNALYETIVEFSRQLPVWAPGTLFVLVSALAPFVAGRLIHFRSEVGSGGESTAPQVPPAPVRVPGTSGGSAAPAQAAVGRQQGSAPPALASAPPGSSGIAAATKPGSTPGSNVVFITGSSRRPVAEWAGLALPHYLTHAQRHGAPPTANDLVQMIRDAHPDLPVPKSDRAARNIRSATETLAASAEDSEPERDGEAA